MKDLELPTLPVASTRALPRYADGEDQADRREAEVPGHGERSRSQLHFTLGGTENLSILSVNASAVNVLAVHSVSYRCRVFLTLFTRFMHFYVDLWFSGHSRPL